MQQNKRFYTFIIAPNANAQFRRINLHYNVIYCILGLAVIGLISVAVGIYSAANYAWLAANFKMASVENHRKHARPKARFMVRASAAMPPPVRRPSLAAALHRVIPWLQPTKTGREKTGGPCDQIVQIAAA